jgi:hypothetical protein
MESQDQNILDKHENLIKIMSSALKYDSESIKNILRRNGVNTDLIKTQEQLNRVFIESMAKSKVIAVDFKKYLNSLANDASLNAAGEDDLFGLFDTLEQEEQDYFDEFGEDFSTTTTSTTNSNNTTQSAGFLSGVTLNGLIDSATKVLELQRDIEKAQGDKEKLAQEIAQQQKEGVSDYDPASKTSKTWIYVTATLAILGVATYFLIKRKK